MDKDSAVARGPSDFMASAMSLDNSRLPATLASFAWFYALGYGARLIAPLFADPRAWRALDIAVGLVMWWIAARLSLSLFS